MLDLGRGKASGVGRWWVKTQGRGGLGCHSLTASLSKPAAVLAPNGFGGCSRRPPPPPSLLTVPCEVRSGSSSRGLRGPVPFARGHFGTATATAAVPHRHRPSLHVHIPGLGPFLRSLCHLVGPAPSTRRGVRAPGEDTHRGDRKAFLKRSSGQCWSLTETTGSRGPQGTQHPRAPTCSPPAAAAAPTAQRFGF